MNSIMPIQQRRPGKPGFPLRLFAAAFVISILATALSGWQAWMMHHQFQELSDKRAHVTEDIGRIMLFDEILTMSAHMTAATGEFAYETRYDQVDAQLTAVINHVKADLPQADIARHIRATDAANLALVKLERQAFALTHRGKLQEALALLNGAEYLELKKVYASGMEKTADAMLAFIAMEQQRLDTLTVLAAAANIAGILVLLVAWFFAARSARHWAAERREAEDCLRKSHDELEVQVKQRTADLSSANEQLRREIAEHQRIKLVLQESESKFRNITESANDAIITAAGAGNITGWNAAAARLFGYVEAEINGQPLTVLMPERFHKLHREGLARVVAGGVPHVIGKTVELAGLRKDGSEFPLEISLSQWQAADGLFFTAIIRDISERKIAEATLLESVTRFSTIFRASPIGISITRLADGTIIDANPKILDTLGYTREEAIGSTTLALPVWTHPEDRDRMLKLLSEQGGLRDFEAQFRAKSGELGYFLVSAEPVDLAGEQCLLALLHDITERKQAETQLTEQLEELRRWHEATSNREQRILSIKHEVNELLVQAGQPPRYPSAEQ